MFERGADRVALAVVLVAVFVGASLAPGLPATVVVPSPVPALPDGAVPRAVALIGGPAVAALAAAVVRLGARSAPSGDPRSVDAAVVATTGLAGALYLLVLAHNAGYRVPTAWTVAGVVLWALVLVGYLVLRPRAA